ncbi:hypothetical protein ACPA9J_30365 [Pseudomonas aeruginosa]
MIRWFNPHPRSPRQDRCGSYVRIHELVICRPDEPSPEDELPLATATTSPRTCSIGSLFPTPRWRVAFDAMPTEVIVVDQLNRQRR